jgi:hypothetical protein
MAFIALCKGYLGIEPHFELWRYFFSITLLKCWYLLTRIEKIRKRTDTVVAFTRRVLNIVSIGKRVSQLRVLT